MLISKQQNLFLNMLYFVLLFYNCLFSYSTRTKTNIALLFLFSYIPIFFFFKVQKKPFMYLTLLVIQGPVLNTFIQMEISVLLSAVFDKWSTLIDLTCWLKLQTYLSPLKMCGNIEICFGQSSCKLYIIKKYSSLDTSLKKTFFLIISLAFCLQIIFRLPIYYWLINSLSRWINRLVCQTFHNLRSAYLRLHRFQKFMMITFH